MVSSGEKLIPSSSQIKWVWEQCGCKVIVKEMGWDEDGGPTWLFCGCPAQKHQNEDCIYPGLLPELCLNNLFQLAIPVLIKKFGATNTFDFLVSWLRRFLFYGEDPTCSLFELIYKCLGGK